MENSNGRMEVLTKFPKPKTKEDVINMLGDESGKKVWVFQDYPDKHNQILTIAVGKFLNV